MTDIATAHGLELSATTYAPGSFAFLGGFTQAQRVFSFKGDHFRFALGGEAGWTIFSLEAGFAYRTADDFRASTAQLHLGTILSFVFFNFGVQMEFPFTTGTSTKPAYPVEVSFLLAIKVPVLLK